MSLNIYFFPTGNFRVFEMARLFYYYWIRDDGIIYVDSGTQMLLEIQYEKHSLTTASYINNLYLIRPGSSRR